MAEVMRPEKVEISSDTSSLASPELLHVLAVDDSIVDRKFIERLLRVSSCKGKCGVWFIVYVSVESVWVSKSDNSFCFLFLCISQLLLSIVRRELCNTLD